MYVYGIRAVSALIIAVSASVGISVNSVPEQPQPTPAVLADVSQNSQAIEASSAAIASESAQKAPEPKIQNLTASNSAELIQRTREQKVAHLQAYLAKHNSPMTDNAQDFVDAAEQYNLDWRLIPSIAGVESTFGKRVLQGSYNPFGWGGGYIKFESWREAIYTVSKGVSEKYVQDGLDTPYKMQKRYAPPSHTWGGKVDYFMNKIATFEPPTTENQ